MKNHWDYLELKLGKDIVKYVIQPMLLPAEGLSISDLRQMLSFELDYFLRTTFRGNRNTPWPHEVKKEQANPKSYLHGIFIWVKIYSRIYIGSSNARVAKMYFLLRIQMYAGGEFKPSQVASWWREKDKKAHMWSSFPPDF